MSGARRPAAAPDKRPAAGIAAMWRTPRGAAKSGTTAHHEGTKTHEASVLKELRVLRGSSCLRENPWNVAETARRSGPLSGSFCVVILQRADADALLAQTPNGAHRGGGACQGGDAR